MTEEQAKYETKNVGQGLVKFEALPPELRAKMLESQQSLFLNVAKFEQGQRVAQMLAQTDFVPKRFQGKVGNCLIALDLAETLNCKPVLLMQSMYIVHDEPAFKGSFVAAMINSSGRYKGKLKYRYDGEGDDYGCTAWAIEKETGETIDGPKVTMGIVKAEGWLAKNGSKWKTMPEIMFAYRAAAWFGRRHDPDLLMGMQTIEEVHDAVDLCPAGNGTYTTDDLTSRLKENAANKDQEPPPQRPGVPGAEGFVCEICNYSAVSERGLKRHITNQHKTLSKEPPPESAPAPPREEPEDSVTSYIPQCVKDVSKIKEETRWQNFQSGHDIPTM